ncbi:MAG TPA: hypothetical protein VEQ65_12615, partial [Opitutus sp.]|nr:hypothetical protein [Opitutus sp.]
LPLSLLSPRAHAAAPATSEAPPLTRIVTRLSAAPQPTARDWAEFARETVTWGSRLQSSQQPVLEGPVRDALSAVDLGAKLDPKTADWPKLREELEALLQKPENQKEDEKQQPPQQDQQQQDQQNRDEQKQDDQQKQEQSSQDPSKKEPQQQDPSQQQQDAKQSPPDSEQKQQEKPSAFGDMKEPPPQPPQETRKVGGVPEKPEGETPPSDPSLALPLQKLDQLKNQDSPAELFKLIEGEKDQPPRKKTKDW